MDIGSKVSDFCSLENEKIEIKNPKCKEVKIKIPSKHVPKSCNGSEDERLAWHMIIDIEVWSAYQL